MSTNVDSRIVVQIPCYNEEATLEATIAEIRKATAAFRNCLILVVDDGSTDGTVEVARKAKADFIARHSSNRGLARAYMTGLAASLNLGADIIVNTDADNQYRAAGIPALIRAISEEQADVAVGARPIEQTEHFSLLKRRLQRLGTRVVRGLSGTDVRDATSGFRAITREAALRLNTFSDYTYTLETLIQAGRSGLRVTSVDIETNPPTRPSRLMRSMGQYILRSIGDMLRISTIYSPLRSYLTVAAPPLAVAIFLGLRYVFLVSLVDPSRSHAPSLILAGILTGLAFLLCGLGIIGEIMTVNRRILEELRINQRRQLAESGSLGGRVDFSLIEISHGTSK
ncbi:glycosyltransferase family 2 protein [Rhodovulum sulfidophilum]|uniref:glycosyltransferase family 2 protein n=1 Tax=Rhodovulum sulfidophilum TaxID=35806 RepID=UPI000951B88D|nr:glycosyltransferase family 2 protein [Rhodovulum sulfidophilum]MBL3554387.1 glycosyltransferase family 2 protein [Rhodovulum sulfidophilum]OLS42311.1 hypothetical protein BV379_20730 [Rhodovulum sulfidophilum]